MMKMIFSMMIMTISIMMIFIYHPLSMVISILCQTLILCLLLGMMMNSYWFMYILLLTFLGGLIVLFVYISSIASNEIFKININWKLLLMLFFMFMLLTKFLYKNYFYWLNINMNEEMFNFYYNYLLFFNNENLINLIKLYNNQTYLLLMMMIIYLFITLIVIVKITNIFLGPLRKFN